MFRRGFFPDPVSVTTHSVIALASVLTCVNGCIDVAAAGLSRDGSNAGVPVVRNAPSRDRAPTLRGGYSAHNVLGLPVQALNAEHIGTIDDIELDRHGRVLAIVVTTPEQTSLRFSWDDTNLDFARRRASVSAPLAHVTAAVIPRAPAERTSSQPTVLVRLLLGSKAWLARAGYGARIDDVILRRDGYAGALVLSGGAASAQLAQPFPSAFAYDASSSELLIPTSRSHSHSAPFRYAELGVVPPRARRTPSQLDRLLRSPRPEPIAGSAVTLSEALTNAAADGCWARMYTDANYQGKPLTLVGPVSIDQLKEDGGFEWQPRYESVRVGPGARLTLYEQRGFRRKTASYSADQPVADLDGTMGIFRSVRSVTLDCAGDT
jgi:hypothetical protein